MGNIDNEDLIPQKDVVITVSSNSYVKRIDLDEYREQKRGGVGSSTVKTYQDDDSSNNICRCSRWRGKY